MKLVKFISIAALLMIFISCSNDDDNSPADELSVSLEFDTYRTGFYQAGETNDEVVVTTTLAGDPVVTLEGVDAAIITYNPLTSKIEWTNLLPLGDNAVTIVATLDGTEATTDITLENDFEGSFFGGYNNSDETDPVNNNLTSVIFDTDGEGNRIITITDDGGNEATGSWSLNEDNTVVTFIITYDEGVTYFTYQGDIFNDGTEAYVDGMWYNGQEAEGAAEGYFRIDI